MLHISCNNFNYCRNINYYRKKPQNKSDKILNNFNEMCSKKKKKKKNKNKQLLLNLKLKP